MWLSQWVKMAIGYTPLTLHAQVPKVIVKSTVGAGDSLLAGMIHGLVNQLPEETLKTATAITML
jgi:1-phosphofructokinase